MKNKFVNKQDCDILNAILSSGFSTQRDISEKSGHSLGVVNQSVKELRENGYLDNELEPTEKARDEAEKTRPRRAIILAAGFGMRMVPINNEVPKGLLEVNGETLIERIIRQLHEVGITEIYVIVGFLKERYEYLIDKYDVRLVVNSEYAYRNNIHSLKLVSFHLANAYIIPCDIHSGFNPFNRYESYSWYMVSDKPDTVSTVRVNRSMELVTLKKGEIGNAMIGISYLTPDTADIIRKRLDELCSNSRYDNSFWEETLYEKNKMIVAARAVPSSEVVEINTYEQLREIDENSDNLKSDAIETICSALNVSPDSVTDIKVLKKGMTNRSFLFKVADRKYIMRIPGEGTDQLINRRQEAEVYNLIRDKDICDNIIYINPENGYKITEFLEGTRVCNPLDRKDVLKCMKRLRNFHDLNLTVDHEFNIFDKIEFYESLWNGEKSAYRDYEETKKDVLSLKPYIESHIGRRCLTHIDAVPDNFLIREKDGKEDIRLIDWEYAGMQDSDVDIAMFAVYAMYDTPKQIDDLIDAYYTEGCSKETRIKIYCYIAACGLLWSNWCEFKRNLGVDFGEYSLRQYRFAKDYYGLAVKEGNSVI